MPDAKCIRVGLLGMLLSTLLVGCQPKGPTPQPVTAAAAARSTPGPVNSSATVTFTIVFDAAVTGLDDPATDVQLNHSGTTGGQIAIATIDDRTFQVSVTGVGGDGSYTLRVLDGASQDGMGQPSPAAESEPVLVDNTTPVVGVHPLTTADTTPALTGTADDPAATISVSVNGQTYTAANNGDGTWTLADGMINPALADGVYNVAVSAGDAAGNIGTEATENELAIDAAGPVITVKMLVTNSPLPNLTGTINDSDASISVVINGQTYTAVNNGDSTWTLFGMNLNDFLAEGVYDIQVTAIDSLQRTATDSTTGELTIDLTPPTVTVEALTTTNDSPPLRGTVDDPAAAISVSLNGQAYDATNNGDGTWTLADGMISPPLPDGVYNVTVTAEDAVGNIGTDDTANELAINAVAPILTVKTLVTKNPLPNLTGTIDDSDASISLIVNGQSYAAVNNGDGTWGLNGLDLVAALDEGLYDVQLSATDAYSRTGTDSTTDELTIDFTSPVVTVFSLMTDDTSPPLRGKVDDPDATVSVQIAGQIHEATNNRDGTWMLAGNTLDPELAPAVHAVQVRATDPAGNTASALGTIEVVAVP